MAIARKGCTVCLQKFQKMLSALCSYVVVQLHTNKSQHSIVFCQKYQELFVHEVYIKCNIAQCLAMFISRARGVLFNASSPIRHKWELSGRGAG